MAGAMGRCELLFLCCFSFKKKQMFFVFLGILLGDFCWSLFMSFFSSSVGNVVFLVLFFG